MGESMKCGSFRFISHLSPLTSWQSWERLLGEGRGFLGLVLLFGSGLVKKPFSGGERGAYSSSRFCPFMRGDLLFALPQASCSRNVLHFIWSYRLPWCQGFELVYVGWRGDMCGSWLPAGATLLQ